MELESERRRNMIFDSISNKENYKEEKEIYQTLNFFEKLKKWDDVESNAIIQKDWISANPVSFLSKDESECMYEAHRKSQLLLSTPACSKSMLRSNADRTSRFYRTANAIRKKHICRY